jgi:hypothetical protein
MPTTQNARCETTFLLFSLLSRLRLRYARCDYRRCAVLCSTSVHLLAIRQCFALKMHLSRLLLSPITMHPHPEPRLSLDTQTPHPNHQRAHPHPLAKQALTSAPSPQAQHPIRLHSASFGHDDDSLGTLRSNSTDCVATNSTRPPCAWSSALLLPRGHR